ncbi:hypothetical protein QUA57_16385 [Microcoleus sp. Pol7_B2]
MQSKPAAGNKTASRMTTGFTRFHVATHASAIADKLSCMNISISFRVRAGTKILNNTNLRH